MNDNFTSRPPYKDVFDIGYPQEEVEGQTNVYRCKFCKRITTDINGLLENHAADCEYRLSKTNRAA
jgi:hypothetical protein